MWHPSLLWLTNHKKIFPYFRIFCVVNFFEKIQSLLTQGNWTELLRKDWNWTSAIKAIDYFAILLYHFMYEIITKCTLGSSFRIQSNKVDGCTIELCTWKSGKIIKARKSLDCVKEQKEWAVEWAREQISLYVAMSTALVLEFMFLCIDPYVFTHQPVSRRKHTQKDVIEPWRNHPLRITISLYYI